MQWKHHGPVLDQGQLGSCTANALCQALNTEPNRWRTDPPLDETAAVGLYAVATTIDPFVGRWPLNDTGSSGLAVCKAAQKASLELKTTVNNKRRELTAQIIQNSWKQAGFDLKVTFEKAGVLFGQDGPSGNFQVALLKDGITRIVNGREEDSHAKPPRRQDGSGEAIG